MQKNSLLQEFDYPLASENGVVDEAEPNISWHVVTPDLLLVPELPHTVRGDVHDVGEPVPHTQTWQGGQEGQEEEGGAHLWVSSAWFRDCRSRSGDSPPRS